MIAKDIERYRSSESKAFSHGNVLDFLSPWKMIKFISAIVYAMCQRIITLMYKPHVPKRHATVRSRGRVAVIGAGMSGISAAAHAFSHGFDVIIYEESDHLGGIWAKANSSSGLQLHSILYRFHPAVVWSRAFPHKYEILKELSRVWREYKLESRTRFGVRVTSVERVSSPEAKDDYNPSRHGHAQWKINDGSDGNFDAVIVAVGTCGDAKWIRFPGMPKESHQTSSDSSSSSSSDHRGEGQDQPHEGYQHHEAREERKVEGGEDSFRGPIFHSSQFDSAQIDDVLGRTVVVIGSGASAVEAVETALAGGAAKCIMLAREDKWIIPRNLFLDVLMAMQPFGREMPMGFVWEEFLKRWHYRGVEHLVPPFHGPFESTPVVNDKFLPYVRMGKCEYVRGDIERLTSKGVLVNVRQRVSKAGDRGQRMEIPADVIVLATGYKPTSVDFLPKDLFPEGYELFLQNFSMEDWSIMLLNSAHVDGIGTVGHVHIGIYTRILLMLMMDFKTRPSTQDMKVWVHDVHYLKHGATGGVLRLFTYIELTLWLGLYYALRPDRWKWLPFILFGWGVHPQYA